MRRENPYIKELVWETGSEINIDIHNFSEGGMQNSKGLFSTFSEKFKLHQNGTILSLQYCKLKRKKSGVCPRIDGKTAN